MTAHDSRTPYTGLALVMLAPFALAIRPRLVPAR